MHTWLNKACLSACATLATTSLAHELAPNVVPNCLCMCPGLSYLAPRTLKTPAAKLTGTLSRRFSPKIRPLRHLLTTCPCPRGLFRYSACICRNRRKCYFRRPQIYVWGPKFVIKASGPRFRAQFQTAGLTKADTFQSELFSTASGKNEIVQPLRSGSLNKLYQNICCQYLFAVHVFALKTFSADGYPR